MADTNQTPNIMIALNAKRICLSLDYAVRAVPTCCRSVADYPKVRTAGQKNDTTLIVGTIQKRYEGGTTT
ncbi:MAG TPA: hypothetical protein VIP51_07445 [Eoetvoesiella sp.]